MARTVTPATGKSSRPHECERQYHADLVKTSPKMWRVYSGPDGESHVAELALDMKPFVDVEGAHGESIE